MNWSSWFIWGFAATIVLTISLSASQGLKLTRINIPLLLGTMVTPQRDKAKWIGIFIHILNGLIFSLIYVAAFHVWGQATWQRGAIIGFIHASFVLAVVLPNLPGIHPRMASETFGPTVTRQLEPPGFWALNYGFQTPLSIVLAHIIFGMILGGFYKF
jgi:uncharacterized membrane protein YagU involved in acid resistance